MKIESCPIPGCFTIQPAVFEDLRGRFVKVFHEPSFSDHGLVSSFAEDYYSVSRKGVLRGMHFQKPPSDHAKLVFCVSGDVLDAVVDLRRGSPTFGRHFTIELTSHKANMLYVPRGVAHGFFTLSDEATVVYKVETTHAPADDAGIAWDGCGVDWPSASPVLSARDQQFPTFADFASPFEYQATSNMKEQE